MAETEGERLLRALDVVDVDARGGLELRELQLAVISLIGDRWFEEFARSPTLYRSLFGARGRLQRLQLEASWHLLVSPALVARFVKLVARYGKTELSLDEKTAIFREFGKANAERLPQGGRVYGRRGRVFERWLLAAHAGKAVGLSGALAQLHTPSVFLSPALLRQQPSGERVLAAELLTDVAAKFSPLLAAHMGALLASLRGGLFARDSALALARFLNGRFDSSAPLEPQHTAMTELLASTEDRGRSATQQLVASVALREVEAQVRALLSGGREGGILIAWLRTFGSSDAQARASAPGQTEPVHAFLERGYTALGRFDLTDARMFDALERTASEPQDLRDFRLLATALSSEKAKKTAGVLLDSLFSAVAARAVSDAGSSARAASEAQVSAVLQQLGIFPGSPSTLESALVNSAIDNDVTISGVVGARNTPLSVIRTRQDVNRYYYPWLALSLVYARWQAGVALPALPALRVVQAL